MCVCVGGGGGRIRVASLRDTVKIRLSFTALLAVKCNYITGFFFFVKN